MTPVRGANLGEQLGEQMLSLRYNTNTKATKLKWHQLKTFKHAPKLKPLEQSNTYTKN